MYTYECRISTSVGADEAWAVMAVTVASADSESTDIILVTSGDDFTMAANPGSLDMASIISVAAAAVALAESRAVEGVREGGQG